MSSWHLVYTKFELCLLYINSCAEHNMFSSVLELSNKHLKIYIVWPSPTSYSAVTATVPKF